MEEEDGSSKIMQSPPAVPATDVAAPPTPEVSPPKKKRPGRPPKNKKKVRFEKNVSLCKSRLGSGLSRVLELGVMIIGLPSLEIWIDFLEERSEDSFKAQL